MEFSRDAVFVYNRKKKIISSLTWIGILFAIAAFIIAYFSLFKESDFFILEWIRALASHAQGQMDLPGMKGASLLGVFYASFIGGLFFVVMSMEGLFLNLLRTEHSALYINLFYIVGLTCSYTANYFIGMRLSGMSKKLVGPRKFYKIKGVINKWGSLAVFLFNVGPLPSQPLCAILGAVKYNKTRFYVFFLSGQIIKYAVITIAVRFFIP